jgi:hypothetical protein
VFEWTAGHSGTRLPTGGRNTTMTRRYDRDYDDSSGTGGNSGDYDDETEIKLQNYATLALTGKRVAAFNGNWGDKFIAGFDDTRVLDGVVLRRDDSHDTWKVFPLDKFKDIGVNEDGIPVDLSESDSVEDAPEMSAQELLDYPYVQTHDETFGGDDYYYTPVGVAVEQAEDVATNDELDVEVEDNGIVVGDSSLMLSNKSWARKLAKLLTEQGDDIIAKDDDGQAVGEDYDWLTTLEPDLREGIEGREMILFVKEDTFTPDDSDEAITYTKPILLDAATEEAITLNNESDSEEGQDTESEPPKAAADGGPQAESGSGSTDTSSPEQTESPETTDDGSESTGNVPEELEELVGYYARTDGTDTTVDDIRSMGEGEVEDPESVDWDAVLDEVHARA